MRAFLLLIVVAFMLVFSTDALFGRSKEEEKKKEKITAKESLALGIDMLHQTANDPDALRETMKMLDDPETRKQINEMMHDPAFVAEMEKMKNNPAFQSALQGAATMFEDPQKAAAMQAELAAAASEMRMTDAEVGMRTLAQTAKNPQMLAEAMEMLKDPEIVKEVQAMMKDPSFQAEMKKYTENPAFKEAMGQATKDIEAMSRDPVKMKKMEAELAAEMKKNSRR